MLGFSFHHNIMHSLGSEGCHLHMARQGRPGEQRVELTLTTPFP